jgi:SAM-dependent methyltransferase
MSLFGENYTSYYNLLYNDKNYAEEYLYLIKLVEKYKADDLLNNILDIGCGTGKHLEFFKNEGKHVTGIDISEDMLAEAEKRLGGGGDVVLVCSKASEFDFSQKFDLVYSLFHVINYQTETDELKKVFCNVSRHLAETGLFVFDFWYGTAVLSDPPAVRIKRIEDNFVDITRIAEPKMDHTKNLVDVYFEVLIEDKITHKVERIYEIHKMRYLFLPEIEFFAKENGLKVLAFLDWMTFNALSPNTWYGVCVMKRI